MFCKCFNNQLVLIFVSHSVKHFAIGRCRNSHGQLMFCVDVERVDAVAADAAAGVASFAVGALAVAVAVKNDDVKSDDFNKTII